MTRLEEVAKEDEWYLIILDLLLILEISMITVSFIFTRISYEKKRKKGKNRYIYKEQNKKGELLKLLQSKLMLLESKKNLVIKTTIIVNLYNSSIL